MRVLLIGGSGNISPAIAAELIRLGHDVTVFNRGNHPMQGVRQLIGDRYLLPDFIAEMKQHTFDCVIDQICYTLPQAEALIDAFSGRIRQLIFCSTVNTYLTPAPNYPVTENSPLGADPEFTYAYQKLLCEQVLGDAAAKNAFHLTIVRPGATYNDASVPISFVGNGLGLLYRISKQKPILLLDGGSSLFGFAHRDDVGTAIAHAVGNPAAYGQGYTIAPKEVMTWEQLYSVIAEEMGVPRPEYVYAPYFVLDQLMQTPHSWNKLNFRFNNIYDCTKAEQELGYRYSITWREGVRRMLRTHLLQGNICKANEYDRYDEIVSAVKKMYQTIGKSC